MGSPATTIRQPRLSSIASDISPWREAELHVGITADELHNYAAREEAKEQIEKALVDLQDSYRFGEDYEDDLLELLNDILHPDRVAWVEEP